MNKWIPFIAILSGIALSACKKDDTQPNFSTTASVGASAHDLLSDSFSSLIIEVHSFAGFAPDAQSLDNLKAFLTEHTYKSGGITFEMEKPLPAPADRKYSAEDIRTLEGQYRVHKIEPGKLSIFLIFINGNSDQDGSNGNVLGMAYNNTSAVMFEKMIQSYSGGLTKPTHEKLETTVLEHEFGHLMGLVSIGSKMQTNHIDDTGHGNHCKKTDCLMFWKTETSNIVENLLNGPVPVLDDNCLSDIQHNGGK